jgi:hypothetical protein
MGRYHKHQSNLLDAALDGQVTITLGAAGSSGSPNALPITDGTASNGRNRMVVFADGADLGATAYVQLTPNDAEKIIYIRNSLSGSRSVILFQGTYNASNDYEVPAGTTAVVYFDGAGAGAVAANVFNNAYFDGLRLGSVSVTAILDEDNMASDSATALATQQSIKAYVDSQVGTVDTLAEILAIGNTTGGTDIVASTTDKVQFRDAAIYINSSVDGQLDIVADTEIQIAATTVDVNGALDVSGTALVTGVLTTTAATVHTGGITMPDNAKAIFGAGSDLQIYHVSADNTSRIVEGGSGNLIIQGTNLRLGNADYSKAYFAADDGGAATIYYNDAAKLATTTTGIDVTGTIVADGLTVDGLVKVASNFPLIDFDEQDTTDLNTRVISTDGQFRVQSSNNGFNTNKNRIIVDHATGDISFYEDLGVTAKFFWDASAESLGIGTSSPSQKLHVAGNIVLNAAGFVGFGGGTNYIEGSATNLLKFGTANAERMRIDSSGNVGIGTTSPGDKLSVVGTTNREYVRVESTFSSSGSEAGIRLKTAGTNGKEYLIFNANTEGSLRIYDATAASERMRIDSSGNVGIGTSSPTNGKLEVTNASSTVPTGFFRNTSGSGDSPSLTVQGGANNAASNFSVLDYNGNTDFVVQGAGNVGIGTSSPSYKLHVSGSNLYLTNSGNTELMTTNTSGGTVTGGIQALSNQSVRVGSITNYPVEMAVNNSVKMTFDTSGSVGIGTTESTKGALTVGKAAPSAAYGQICALSPTASDSNTSGMSVVKYANDSTTAQVLMRFLINQGGAGQGQINANGANTAAFGSYSDSRLKENIVDLPSQLDSIMALRPVEYDYIESMGGGHQIGFVAQEVQAIYPDLVGEDAEGMLTLTDMNKNDARLIKAIQEQQAIIEALEARITALEG